MPWWNLYKTENDADLATIARVDSELEALNQARRAKKEQEAADLEDLGLGDDADQLRDGLDEYDRLHAINLKTQNDALKETSADAFDTELDARAAGFRNGVATTIGTTLGTAFKLLPWWLWLAIAAAAFFYFGGARYLPAKKTRRMIPEVHVSGEVAAATLALLAFFKTMATRRLNALGRVIKKIDKRLGRLENHFGTCNVPKEDTDDDDDKAA